MNQHFSFLFVKHYSLNLQKLLHISSYNSASHYDTLKVRKNCSSKQIRESFIKLSKENHPDINKSPNAHKEFLKIQEAYKVLSKPDSRAAYDAGLPQPGSPGSRARYSAQAAYRNRARYNTPPYGRNPWDDPYFYHNRDRSRDSYYENRPYYGIKGINKASNGTVAFVIVSFTAIMFILQMIAIRHTVHKQQNIMNKRSMDAQKILDHIKEQAEKNGNAVQSEIHRKQFEEIERRRVEEAAARSKDK